MGGFYEAAQGSYREPEVGRGCPCLGYWYGQGKAEYDSEKQ